MGIFSVVTDINICPSVDSASKKMSTRDYSWGKGGRCVRLTTYHPRSAERQENPGGGLNLPGTHCATSVCCGRTLSFISDEYVWCMCLRIVCSIRVLGMWNLAFGLFRTRRVKTSPEARKNIHHGGWWLGRCDCRKTSYSGSEHY